MFTRKEMKCYMFSLFSLTHSYVEVSAVKHFYSVGKYMTIFLIPFDLHLVYFSYYVSPHKSASSNNPVTTRN
jgi:hypothetical protein